MSVSSSLALPHHIFIRIAAFLVVVVSVASAIYGMGTNALITLVPAHQVQPGATFLAVQMEPAKIITISLKMEHVLPCLSNALLPLSGMAMLVPSKVEYVRMELFTTMENAYPMSLVNMVIYGTRLISDAFVLQEKSAQGKPVSIALKPSFGIPRKDVFVRMALLILASFVSQFLNTNAQLSTMQSGKMKNVCVGLDLQKLVFNVYAMEPK